jgi:hypothetical protein
MCEMQHTAHTEPHTLSTFSKEATKNITFIKSQHTANAQPEKEIQ